MKRTILAVFLLLTALCAFAQSGVLRDISGTVELKPAGAASFVAANVGDQVREDTVISTGFKSNALVEVGSTVIAVRPLTRLTLTEIRSSTGSETINVNLQSGRVSVDVNPPAGTRASMTVTSPSATASVRGTGFHFDGRHVSVTQGTVGFQGNKGQPVPVSGGFAAGVTNTGKAGNAFYTGAGTGRTGGSTGPASGPASTGGTDAIVITARDGSGSTGILPGAPSGVDTSSSITDIVTPPTPTPPPPDPTPTPPPPPPPTPDPPTPTPPTPTPPSPSPGPSPNPTPEPTPTPNPTPNPNPNPGPQPGNVNIGVNYN